MGWSLNTLFGAPGGLQLCVTYRMAFGLPFRSGLSSWVALKLVLLLVAVCTKKPVLGRMIRTLYRRPVSIRAPSSWKIDQHWHGTSYHTPRLWLSALSVTPVPKFCVTKISASGFLLSSGWLSVVRLPRCRLSLLVRC